MKIVKIVIIVIISLLLLLGVFIKKTIVIERKVTINKPKQIVFDYIKYLKNQDNFSKWATMDSNMKKEFVGTDGTVGFVSKWDSKKDDVGKGEQEIKAIVEGENIDFALHFIKPFESNCTASMITTTVNNNETLVSWKFTNNMKFPFNVLGLFMNMDKMIGDDLQIGLNNLKTLLEK
jgi:hypothetical protein